MRLLNTETLQMKEFLASIPPYAILSHTWDKEEVTFRDMQDLDIAKSKAGFAKVKGACMRARRYNFDWIWIDSCCINKESSAELSEAINSMYQYYEDAEVCYVYLYDVSAKHHPREHRSSFRKSKWFRRGWTLQELLAPSYVVFFDKQWMKLGTRWSLRDVVSATTSIPIRVFEGHDINGCSVAQRMSWAAYRETTRPEDQAYCLLGIFGVSMPPIYGEGGAKAFMRLQQEIIKISDDRSIFAWISSFEDDEPRGLLARSPLEFRMSGEVLASESDIGVRTESYSFGNNKLRIHLPIAPTNFSDDIFIASLHCQSERGGSYICVYLQRTNGHQYIRYHATELALIPSRPAVEHMQELTVKEAPSSRRIHPRGSSRDAVTFHIKTLPSARKFGVTPAFEESNDLWVIRDRPIAAQDGVTMTITLSCWVLPKLSLEYIFQTTQETFSIEMHHNSYYKTISTVTTSSTSMDGPVSGVDSLLIPLGSGGFLSVACEILGDRSEKILEIDYIPTGDHKDALQEKSGFLPLHSGFMVPSDEVFTLQTVFPPDSFRKELEGQIYVSMADADPSNMFCVLTYTHSHLAWFSYTGPCVVYVALGYQGSSAWTDVIVRRDQNGDSTDEDEIWNSYLNSGSRALKRLNCQTSAAASVLDEESAKDSKYNVTVEVKKRKALGLGSHMLSLDYIWNGGLTQTQHSIRQAEFVLE
ncbi:hypothetical protein D9758_012251 [Tetrapyrgos nigripes]|uniref:Heterokaryon incompatibility domain-containing protein n=1 Tax=Tetrapyrgos nigripes TaxID=182062 RepID=A0A8H5FLV3_9AGAR|nr:hypothetical protein D9758_012251 [Tetrapyrgos nigripes]